MPTEKARISIYEISKCGYFEWGEKTPRFGDIEDILADLAIWAKGKPLVATKTYEQQDYTELNPTYLLDIKNKGSNWLIKIWNETPSTSGNVHSVMGASNVGNPTVIANKIAKGSIPGFATYFWVMPKENIFASVGFQHLITGQPAFQQYVESYMQAFSKYVVHAKAPAKGVDIEILGYRAKNTADPEDLSPKFQTNLYRKPGPHIYLLQNVDKITRAVKKTKLQLNRTDDLQIWQQFLRWTNISQPQAKPADFINLRYIIGATITKPNLQQIIKEWKDNTDRQWDDYGFVIKGSSKVHWLSHATARGEFELDVLRDNDEIINTDSLINALTKRKQAILKLLS